MSNMRHYDKLKTVPANALKPITAGRLKGKSDISPQWRTEAMTEEFGPCGIGWKYEIVNSWTQQANDNQLMIFAQINLYIINESGEWSAAIPAIGGDFAIKKESGGMYANDECYKMAVTDALGVAMKMLGVAADVYRGLANDSKYGREQPNQTPAQSIKPAPQATQGPITSAQSKQLVALAKENGLSGDDMKNIIKFKYRKDSSKELTELQGKYLIENLSTLWESFVASQSKGA